MEKRPLLSHFLWYLNIVKAVFSDARTKRHACEMGVASIVAACPKTITSLVEFNARHGNPALNHSNWSASYRLLSIGKWKPEELSWAILDSALEFIGADEPVMLAIDDTLLHKTGRRIKGCAYARDPLSPPFQANLVWGAEDSLPLCPRQELGHIGIPRGASLLPAHAVGEDSGKGVARGEGGSCGGTEEAQDERGRR